MKINDIRAQIDVIDDQLVDLFLKRLQLCKQIGELKRKKNMPVFNQLREEEILHRVAKASSSKAKYVKQLFCEIFKICKNIQSE